MSSFIANCLRLYNLSLQPQLDLPVTDRRPGDDAAILAAMGYIHLHAQGQPQALLRCTLILEDLLRHSRHNYDALLLLIRVYILQGATSKAYEHYLMLNIKNVQYLTHSWMFWTRASTRNAPGDATTAASAGPLTHVLEWISRNESRFGHSLIDFLESGNYRNVIDFVRFAQCCESSITKHILHGEISRLEWMNNWKITNWDVKNCKSNRRL